MRGLFNVVLAILALSAFEVFAVPNVAQVINARRPLPSRAYEARSPSPSRAYVARAPLPSRAYVARSPKPSKALEARSPAPSKALNARSPKPSHALQARSPKPSKAFEVRSPKPSKAFEARSPKPSKALEARSPKPSKALEARAPKPSRALEAREPKPSHSISSRDEEEQIPMTEEEKLLDTLCPHAYTVCPLNANSRPPSFESYVNDGFECADFQSDLNSCGGCGVVDERCVLAATQHVSSILTSVPLSQSRLYHDPQCRRRGLCCRWLSCGFLPVRLRSVQQRHELRACSLIITLH